MTNQIAIIDPFINAPEVHCFNGLVELLGLRASYHLPSSHGIESLRSESVRTKAYIVLGSASHVHQKLAWHTPLANFLLEELEKNKPVLGCCFGHQLMCHALGAEVDYCSEDQAKIIGTRRITILEDSTCFLKGESFLLGVSHRQVVKILPKEFKEIGRGLENDLVVHESLPFMGTQAHPEASINFCQSNIQGIQDDEIGMIRKDGSALIRRFFHHYELI